MRHTGAERRERGRRAGRGAGVIARAGPVARRYARLYRAVVAANWARFWAFRANPLLALVHAAVYLGSTWAFFAVLFGHVTTLGGWTRGEVYLFLGTAYLTDFLWMLLWFFGLLGVPDLIRTGDLDLLLCKPANTLFLCSTRQMDLDQWAGLVVGVALVAWSAAGLHLRAGPGVVALYLLLLFNGVTLFYGLTVAVTALAFISPRLHLIGDLMEWFYAFAMKPDGVYRGALRLILTFVIPAVVMMNVPARALTLRLAWWQAPWALAVGGGVLFLALRLWSKALRLYTSASS